MSRPVRTAKTLKIFRYEHGGSRIYFEDDAGNRELVADTYQVEDRDVIFNALHTALEGAKERP